MSHSLDPIPPGQPVTVATWIRADQLKRYKTQAGGWIDTLPSDTWVTDEPHLKEFCSHFADTSGGDPDLLTLRLEQRLGLAPHSAKTTFVSFTIADPDPAKNIFRPCASAAIDTTTCAIRTAGDDTCGDPQRAKSCEAQNLFFYKQYYSSYGAARPTGFPWTSLGYTFDWALGPSDATAKPPSSASARASTSSRRDAGHDRRRGDHGRLLRRPLSSGSPLACLVPWLGTPRIGT